MTDTEIQTIKDFLNLARRTGKEVAEAVAKEIAFEHRTNQQSIVRSMLLTLTTYSEMNETKKLGHDARNEAAVRVTKELRDLFESGDYYLPYV